MATIQHKSHDKTVATIAERNSINPRTPGMMVLVRDAIGDPYAGSGRAVYRWDEVQASWILMFKDNVETLTFTGESKSISQDRIQLSNIPANGQVWDVMVRDSLVVHQVEYSVSGSVVTIYPNVPGEFDGQQLSVRYAYGTMTQQLDLEIARVVGEAVEAIDKEAVGLGNVDNTSDLDKPISTATQAALGGKSDSGHAHGAATTSAAGFMSAADKGKLDGVAKNANNYTHPANHPPSIITQDAENRFVTDAEKAAWNGKEASGTAAAAMSAHTSDADPHGQYLPKAGGTMSGTINFSLAQTWPTFNQPTTGNAATATKLSTSRTLTLGSTGKAFDGSGNLTWTLAEIGAQAPLVSGTNIKTINGQSVLGAGNLVAGLSNFTESVSTLGENSTTKAAVSLTATGSGGNIDFCIVPKGAGAVLAQVPNGNTVGGKKRGEYAVDFQMLRNSSSQVARGNNSFIGGGKNNTAEGTSSAVAGGHGNTVMDTGNTTFIGGGRNNTALGSDTVIGGGTYNVASGNSSTIPGGNRATTNGLLGLLAYGFYGNDHGQNQMAFWGGQLNTADATATRITADATAASATNQLVLRNSSAFRVRGTVVARNISSNDAKEWTFEALIKRGANAAATSIVGTPTLTSTFADADAASWAIAISADTTNGALAITGTGAASTSIRWTAVVHSIEVA